jgi:hypothetical protein
MSQIAQSLKRMVPGWTTRIRFPAGARILLFTTAPRPTLGLTQRSVQRVPTALSLGVKLAQCVTTRFRRVRRSRMRRPLTPLHLQAYSVGSWCLDTNKYFITVSLLICIKNCKNRCLFPYFGRARKMMTAATRHIRENVGRLSERGQIILS